MFHEQGSGAGEVCLHGIEGGKTGGVEFAPVGGVRVVKPVQWVDLGCRILGGRWSKGGARESMDKAGKSVRFLR